MAVGRFYLQDLLLSCKKFDRTLTNNYEIAKFCKNMSSSIKKKGKHRGMRVNRTEEAKKWQGSSPSLAYLQVLGSGYGSPKGLALITDHRKYLFNCGEGMQRMAQEHKIKLVNFEHVLITHNSWENLGGLPGLTLTAQSIGVPKMQLHGPSGVEDLFTMTTRFVQRRYIDIEKHDFHDENFEDGALKITYVPLMGPEKMPVEISSSDDDEPIDYYDKTHTLDTKRICTSPNGNKSKRRKLSPQLFEQNNISVAYICKLHDQPGELLMDKCLSHGVPVGPLLGKLKNGEDVTLPNGSKVRSADVVATAKPGPLFIVVDCPSEHFLDPLLNASCFHHHQDTASCDEDMAEIVAHFTPVQIMQHPKYLEWINRFSPSTCHIFINEACSGLSSIANVRLQQKLHLINSEIFPILECENESQLQPWKDLKLDIPNVVFAEPLLIYHLRPKTKCDRKALLTVESEEYIKEVMEIPEFPKLLLDVQSNGIKSLDSADDMFPVITFLGTGSSVPSKCRNVSSILVQISPNHYLLLDCGEGTYDQILKLFGSAKTAEILKKLHAVYISHLHADHHLGLIKLLLARCNAFEMEIDQQFYEVYLLAPYEIRNWLKSYHKKFEPVLNTFRLMSNEHLCGPEVCTEEKKTMLQITGLKQVSTVEVLHCKHSFGIIFTTDNNNRKIVYSGDTMPCDSLIKSGIKCDILIHEATMDDDLKSMARSKTHSTTSEAIEMGLKMEAKFTILTHFSQRYPKIPLFNDHFHNSVGIAFDNMTVTWHTIQLIPYFNALYKSIFREDYEEMEDNRIKNEKNHESTSDNTLN